MVVHSKTNWLKTFQTQNQQQILGLMMFAIILPISHTGRPAAPVFFIKCITYMHPNPTKCDLALHGTPQEKKGEALKI